MLKLAVTLSLDPHRPADFLRHTYIRFCQELGVWPLLIPNTLDDPAAYAQALDLDGLLLSGGGDVHPSRYGAPNTHSDEIAPERDATEWRLLDWATAHHKPVIGICRGMQVLNVYFGGALVQDIAALLPGGPDHTQGDHPIALTHARLADTLGGAALRVNSFHHQGVTAATLAPELEGIALSEEDGVVEALWHRALPVLGVQWHPERPGPSAEVDRRLLRACLDGSLWHLRG